MGRNLSYRPFFVKAVVDKLHECKAEEGWNELSVTQKWGKLILVTGISDITLRKYLKDANETID